MRHIWRPRRFRTLLDRFAGRTPVPEGRAALLGPRPTRSTLRRAGDRAARRAPRSPRGSRRCARTLPTPPIPERRGGAARRPAGRCARPWRTSPSTCAISPSTWPALAPAVERFAAPRRGAGGARRRRRHARFRGLLRAHLARILRRLRLRLLRRGPPRPAAGRHRRALRRADPACSGRAARSRPWAG